MTAADVLLELLMRLGANGGAPVLIGAQELSEWPADTVTVLATSGLLTKTRDAGSITCPGCERQCAMPVHVAPLPAGSASAFIVCDKRNDMSRVPVPIQHLQQWQSSGQAIAALLSTLLDLPRTATSQLRSDRWEIGRLRGTKHASHVVLTAVNGQLQLILGGQSVALADVLHAIDGQFSVDRTALTYMVDHPVAGGGDAESAAQREARLRARRNELQAAGVRDFLKVLAKEEDITPVRLKQILYRRKGAKPIPALIKGKRRR
jgi:hypothetical protein